MLIVMVDVSDKNSTEPQGGPSKQLLRKQMREKRNQKDPLELAEKSRLIVSHLEDSTVIRKAAGVALFWPMLERHEVDLRALDSTLRARGASVYYPFMRVAHGVRHYGFARTQSTQDLIDEGSGFLEPRDKVPALPGEIDLVLVPALAADRQGQRIGYGAGFYDQTLPQICPPAQSCIVAYAFQVTDDLPSEVHDQACDFVVSELGFEKRSLSQRA